MIAPDESVDTAQCDLDPRVQDYDEGPQDAFCVSPLVSDAERAARVVDFMACLAPTARGVWAQRVLDAFAVKKGCPVPQARPVRGAPPLYGVIGWCVDLGGEPVGLAEPHDGVYPDPAAARIAAATLAAHRDPSLAWVKR